MIEYIYDAIKATAGEEIAIAAKITDETGKQACEACHLNIYDNDGNILATAEGVLYNGEWQFVVPAEKTTNLTGRYWYCICDEEHLKLNFKQPLYLV